MAHTYTFTSVTSGSTKFKIDSGPSHILEQSDIIDQIDSTHISITGFYSAISQYISRNGAIIIDLAVDTIIANGVTYGPGSNIDTVTDVLNPLFPKAGGAAITTLDQLADTATRVAITPAQKANIDTNTIAVKLPVNSVIGYAGDSLMANGLVTGSNPAWGNNGMTYWASFYSGFVLFMPPTGFKALGGTKTSDILIQLDAVLALKPKVVIMNGGINDILNSITEQAIKNNLRDCYGKCKAAGAKVIAFNIFPNFGGSALTGPQETIRVNVNAYTATFASSDFIVIDGDVVANNSTYYSDGRHPNMAGARIIGQYVANKIALLVNIPASPFKISDQATVDNSYASNPLMTGTTGSVNGGASGSIATNWVLSGTSAGGATVVGSKTTDNGLNQQVVTISGNYTGSSVQGVSLASSYTTVIPSVGDVMEGFMDIEILTIDANIRAITLETSVLNAGGGTTYGFGGAYFEQEIAAVPFIAGDRIVLRTVSFTVGAGVPGQVFSKLNIRFIDRAVSTPIAASFKIHKISAVKVTGVYSPAQLKVDGKLLLDTTVTAAGSTGNKTINKASGTVNIAAAGTSVTVTNSLVTVNSIVLAVVRTADSTSKIKNVVPGAGSFVINLEAAATAETSIGFTVFN